MRGSFIALAALVAITLVARGRHRAEPEAELTLAILTDVADLDGPGISWNTSSEASHTTLWQDDPVALAGNTISIHVEAESWTLELSPSKVYGVTCYTFGDYDHPWGWISFQPEGGDNSDALFLVGFTSDRIAAFEDVCAKYDIPVER